MKSTKRILLALVMTGSAHAALQNLLIDGNFDNLGAGAPTTTYTLNTFETVTTRKSGTAQGWYLVGLSSSTSGQDLDCIVISTNIQNCNNIGFGTTPTLSPDGGNFLSVDGDSQYSLPIAQNVAIVSGQRYNLSFYQAAAQQAGVCTPSGTVTCPNITEQWQVTLNGSTAQTSALITIPNEGFSGWTHVTMSFLATSTNANAVLQFVALGTPAGFPPIALLDGVVLTTPEPSSWAMMAFALLALPLARRRMRR